MPSPARAFLSNRVLAGVLPVNRARLLPEIFAGLTLAAIAIPEVMGYTKIAGTPVITGLYTLLLPMVLFSLFCSSRHLVVGADSATAAILATALAGMAATGSDHFVALAGFLALMVGALLIAASIARIGFMADFLSRTVLTGFLTGVGIQVALKAVLGMGEIAWPKANGLEAVMQLPAAILAMNGSAAALSCGVLGLMFVLRLVSPKIPGPILALGLAFFVSWVFGLSSRLAVVGPVPGGLPGLTLPAVEMTPSLVFQLGPTALAVLVVILAQSTATARAYARRYGDQLEAGADLRALGLANLGAGLTGTFVVNGSPTKSQMVDSAGGRSQLAMLVTAAVVVLVLLFFTELLTGLPEAALSALVFKIGLDLIDLKGLKQIYQERRPEFWVSLATIFVVVLAGVGPGIVLAIVLSLILHTRHGYHPVNLLLVQAGQTDWKARPLASGQQALPGVMIYRFTHSMYYANADRLAAEVRQLAGGAEAPLSIFCIDFSCVDDIDFTALETLKQLETDLQANGTRLLFVQVLDDPASHCRRQLRDSFGADAIFGTLEQFHRHVDTSPGSGISPSAPP